MKQQTIYIIRPIQIFVSVHDMGNDYAWQHYHGERELEPRIAFNILEERKLRREMEKEYKAKGLKVVLQAETFITRKKIFIEAIEKYKTEVGV